MNWLIIDGRSPINLDNYIEQKEKKYSTKVRDLIHYREIKLPNRETFDFAHLFAAMDEIISSSSILNYAHLTDGEGILLL